MVKIALPDGVEASLEGGRIKLKGKKGSAERGFNEKYVSVRVNQGSIEIIPSKAKSIAKEASHVENALASEIKAMIDGVQNGVEEKLQVVFAHFPITFEAKGDKLYIKNIFGERVPRVTRIIGDTKVSAQGQEIIVYGSDPYAVRQTAANIRLACKMPGKDSRVFQDGVYRAIEE
ncbi:MAG: hypothetical protein QXM58_01450 [Candidatus Micrarchaeaceae archaeon]